MPNEFTLQAGNGIPTEESFLEETGDFLKYGLSSAAVSAGVQFVNTGKAFANVFGADFKETSVYDVLQSAGMESTASYYKDNQSFVDAIGFVAGSLIPGTAAIKGLRYAQKGLATSTRLSTGFRKALIPEDGLEVVRQNLKQHGVTAANAQFQASKLRLAVNSLHQEALESIAFTGGVALSLNQSPSITEGDLNYFDGMVQGLDIWSLGFGIGTAVGGTFKYFGDRGLAKSLLNDAELKNKSNLRVASEGQRNNIINGDALQAPMSSYVNLKKKKYSEDWVNLSPGEQADINATLRQARENVQKELKTLIPNDPELMKQVWGIIDTYDIENAKDLTHRLASGVDSFSRVTDKDTIFEAPVGQVEILNQKEFEDTYIKYMKDNLYPSLTIDEVKKQPTVQKQLQSLGLGLQHGIGTAFDRKRGILGIVNKDAPSLNETNNLAEHMAKTMAVFRHEMGHTLLDAHLGNKYINIKELGGNNPLAQKIRASAEALSRKRRPDGWMVVDAVNSGTLGQNYTGDITRLIKYSEYIQQSNEVMADAYSIMRSMKPEQALKEHPELYKFMVNNKALDRIYRKGKEVINLKTGEIQKTSTIPTAGDYKTKPKLNKNGDKVIWGNNGERSIQIPKKGEKGFDVFKIHPTDANAIYAMSKTRTDIKAGDVIDEDDLAGLTTALAQGIPIKVRQTAQDGTSIEIDAVPKGILGDDSVSMLSESLDDVLIRAKIKKGMEMIDSSNRAKYLADNTKVEGIDYAEGIMSPQYIARILDVGPEFVENLPFYRATLDSMEFGGLPSDILREAETIPFWSARPDFDTTTPTFMKIIPDSRAVKDGWRIAGDVETRNRIKAEREIYQNMFMAFTGEDFKRFAPNASMSEENFADQITKTDEAGGFISQVAPRFESGVSTAQQIGRANHDIKLKKHSEIDNTFEAVAVSIKEDMNAVYEMTALVNRTRQQASGKGFVHAYENIETFLKNNFADKDLADVEVQTKLSALQAKGILDSIIEANPSGTAVRRKIYTKEYEQAIKNFVMAGPMDPGDIDDITSSLQSMAEKHLITIKNDNLAKLVDLGVGYNQSKVIPHKQNISIALGRKWEVDNREIYFGPIDANLYKFHAIVKSNDKGIMSGKDVGMVHAADEKTLRDKIAKIKAKYGESVEIHTDPQIKTYKELWDQYKASDLFGDSVMDSSLARQGLAWEVMPEPNPRIVDEYIDMWKRQQSQLTDGFTELHYSEEIGMLRNYSDAEEIYNSTYGKKAPASNVFKDTYNVMMNRSGGDPNSIWKRMNVLTSETTSRAFYGILGAFRSSIQSGDWKKMNQELKAYGLDQVYSPMNQLILHDINAPKPVLERWTAKMNTFVSMSMLRMDPTHAIVNMASLPIQLNSEISNLYKIASKDRVRILKDGTSITIPGTQDKMPSIMGLIYQAIKDLANGHPSFGSYAERGLTDTLSEELRNLNGQLSKSIGKKDIVESEKILDRALSILTKPTDWSEKITKQVSARVAELMVDTLNIPDNIKWSTINTFVNRVNGNYLASQRPQLFQGWIGQAVGLFQTYQFNMIQNFLRNIESGNKAGISRMVGLQAGIFGMQSLPGFQLLNNIIGERSQENNDFYNSTVGLLGDEVGNSVLYGLASSATIPVFGDGIDLYSRGDLTPRTPILIPTSIADVPAISITNKFAQSVLGLADQIENGAPWKEAMLQALSNNGLNRPIQGIAQIIAGERTTNQGNLLFDYKGADMLNVIAKGMGTKKLDEAIAVDSYYRTLAYESARQSEINELGEAVRTSFRSGEFNAEMYSGFMKDYISRGGKADYFNRWVLNNMKNATQSQIDQLRQKNNSPEGRYLQGVMGADIETLTSDGDVELLP